MLPVIPGEKQLKNLPLYLLMPCLEVHDVELTSLPKRVPRSRLAHVAGVVGKLEKQTAQVRQCQGHHHIDVLSRPGCAMEGAREGAGEHEGDARFIQCVREPSKEVAEFAHGSMRGRSGHAARYSSSPRVSRNRACRTSSSS